MRVLLDSNVFVSAVLLGRNCEEILSLARAGVLQLLSSEGILSEVERVMRRKFRWSQAEAGQLVEELRSLCTLVECDPCGVEFLPDPDDAKVLACAVAGKVDVIVTGDRKHLLPLGRFRGVPIISPAELLDRLG